MKAKPKVTAQRKVQIVLGLLWLLDGALQLQNQMFTSSFASRVIALAAQGQPQFVTGPMTFGIHLFLMHTAIFNSLFAATQLGIGVLILWKRTVLPGLLLSVLWGFIVWVFGEGYGGIFSAHTLLLMGAPGAVIIYVILALAVMPLKDKAKEPRDRPRIAYWLVFVWLVLWVGGGVYQLLPGQDSTSDMSSMIAANASDAPGWLSSLDTRVANTIQGFGKTAMSKNTQTAASMHMTAGQMAQMPTQTQTSTQSNSGNLFILLLAVIDICIGFGVLKRGITRKLAISLGIIFSLVFWVIGQRMGGYFTGLETDPNSGPLFVFLGLTILCVSDLDEKLSGLGYKIQSALVGKPDPS
ncbi:MAG: hypothetical protein ACREF5_02825 [Candidatus Saccharimonadales bacterium]